MHLPAPSFGLLAQGGKTAVNHQSDAIMTTAIEFEKTLLELGAAAHGVESKALMPSKAAPEESPLSGDTDLQSLEDDPAGEVSFEDGDEAELAFLLPIKETAASPSGDNFPTGDTDLSKPMSENSPENAAAQITNSDSMMKLHPADKSTLDAGGHTLPPQLTATQSGSPLFVDRQGTSAGELSIVASDAKFMQPTKTAANPVNTVPPKTDDAWRQGVLPQTTQDAPLPRSQSTPTAESFGAASALLSENNNITGHDFAAFAPIEPGSSTPAPAVSVPTTLNAAVQPHPGRALTTGANPVAHPLDQVERGRAVGTSDAPTFSPARPRSPSLGYTDAPAQQAQTMPTFTDLQAREIQDILVPEPLSPSDGPMRTPIGPALSADFPAPPQGPSLGRQVIQHLADLQPRAGERIEITLSPEELGRVRLSATQTDQGVVLLVQAERPETLDLMRRHLPDLMQDLRSMGFGDVHYSGEQQKRQPPVQPAVSGQSLQPESAQHPDIPSMQNGTGLDLRL